MPRRSPRPARRISSVGALCLVASMFAGLFVAMPAMAQAEGPDLVTSLVLDPATSVAPGDTVTATFSFLNTGTSTTSTTIEMSFTGVTNVAYMACSGGGLDCRNLVPEMEGWDGQPWMSVTFNQMPGRTTTLLFTGTVAEGQSQVTVFGNSEDLEGTDIDPGNNSMTISTPVEGATTPTTAPTETPTHTPTEVAPTETSTTEPSATAPMSAGNASITIVTASGNPIPDDTVVCIGSQCQSLDELGGAVAPSGTVATFAGLTPGAYPLTVLVNSALVYSASITVAAGETTEVTIVIDSVAPTSVPGTPDGGNVVPGDGSNSDAGDPGDNADEVPSLAPVTSLPSTGTGAEGSWVAYLVLLFSAALIAGAGFVALKHRRP